MKVDGYTASFNAQYFSYKTSGVEISGTQTRSEEFQSDASLQTQTLTQLPKKSEITDNSIVKELTASLLKDIQKRTQQDSFQITSTYFEAEALNFEAKAYIKTADKEMEINLQVSLSRSFVQQTKISFENMPLKDPLVLNLNGSMPALSSTKFSFDIDSDGKADQISMLQAGNAFLALDKNENGKIDNGSELFGANTGDGFSELAQYDDDKNGWIDENDAIFNKLRVWKKSEGKSELIALGEVGIGAIFLGNIATPFELKDSSNTQLGQLKNSGFFVFGNRKAGVISQLDLAVSKQSKAVTEEPSLVDDVIKKLNTLNESMKKLKATNSYKSSSDSKQDSVDKTLEKLRGLLQSLEARLSNATGGKKVALETQISSINAQIISLITQGM